MSQAFSAIRLPGSSSQPKSSCGLSPASRRTSPFGSGALAAPRAEAYTLAIVLAEALGLESFRQRVKIYATDVDEEALVQARQASYSARDLQPVSPTARKYFEEVGNRFVFRPDLRGRHLWPP